MPTEKNINTTMKLREGQVTKPEAKLKKELETAAATTGSRLVEIYIPEENDSLTLIQLHNGCDAKNLWASLKRVNCWNTLKIR